MNDYPAPLLAEAQRLSDGGWNPAEITRILRRNGSPVSEPTVRRWVDPEYAARQREWNRRAQALHRVRENPPRFITVLRRQPTREYAEARAKALVQVAGLTPGMAARAMTFDFDEPWTDHRVRTLVGRRAHRDGGP